MQRSIRVPSTGRPMVLHTRVVTGTGGGPEKTILNSPRFLRRYGFDAACLFMRPPGDEGFAVLERKAAAADAEITGLDDRGPFDWNVIRQCIRVCREREVTIWHGHDYKSNAMGLIVQKFHPMHLVTTAHGWVRFTSRTPLYYRIDRFCLKRYREVICVSQDLVEACRQAGVASERLQLIDNAIVLDDYSTAPPSLKDRAKFGFDSGVTLIGAAGRLSEEKGFHHLIDAVARLIRDGHRIGLVIAGEGHLRDQLQQQINQHELQSHIRLAGFLSDPRDFYKAVDLFVLSSIREGLPNVVLEAMASKRPVVVTACNGIPRLVENDRNGVVVRPDSVEALYNGIQKCLSSHAFCKTIAAAGRETIEEQFCFDRRMQKVIRVYGKLSDQLSAYVDRRLSSPASEASMSVDTRMAVGT
jgi:glycosyltransferase involved in cell wall biosynthesis